ncbi:MAG: thermonuclease family protein [Deltaproteobacteria bacterium]|nr:thermonuclease family protein [Deltaproteobacteria bacterium]MBL7205003.1 thermonuclease family protein [Desulfobacteraceae bacterium]
MNTNISIRNPLTIYAILITFLFLLPAFSFAGQFKVTKVYNGNTVKAVGRENEIEVRLVGIDTPEISKKEKDPGQPFSQQAKDFLAGLVLNKTVYQRVRSGAKQQDFRGDLSGGQKYQP